MATTTNYGWTTPDDTALVKDGASAIRTLGSSVDTTTKALNPETTLGDISYRSSSANVKTRLGIGSTGNVLTVAGGVPTWSAPAAAASGLTLVKTQTIGSGVSSVSVSGAFSSTYDNYLIVLSGGVASLNNWLLLNFGSTTTGYYHVNFYGDANSAGPSAFAGSNDSSMYFGAGSANSLNGQATIIAPNLAKRTNVYGTTMRTTTTSSKSRWLSYGGFENSDTQHTAFTLTAADAGDGNGTLTGGTIKVYGYQN